jgi:hypothetical protein
VHEDAAGNLHVRPQPFQGRLRLSARDTENSSSPATALSKDADIKPDIKAADLAFTYLHIYDMQVVTLTM